MDALRASLKLGPCGRGAMCDKSKKNMSSCNERACSIADCDPAITLECQACMGGADTLWARLFESDPSLFPPIEFGDAPPNSIAGNELWSNSKRRAHNVSAPPLLA